MIQDRRARNRQGEGRGRQLGRGRTHPAPHLQILQHLQVRHFKRGSRRAVPPAHQHTQSHTCKMRRRQRAERMRGRLAMSQKRAASIVRVLASPHDVTAHRALAKWRAPAVGV